MIRPINGSRRTHGSFIHLAFTALIVISLSSAVATQSRLPVDKLIPRSTIFADEDKLNVRLSPNGETIVYIVPTPKGDEVFATSVDDPASSRLLFRQNDGSVGNLQWAYSSQQLIFLKAVGQDIHLYVFNLGDGQIRDLTPQTGISARIEKLSPEHPQEVLISLKKSEARRFDLYRLNLQTGDSTLLLKNDSYDSCLCDDEFRPRVAIRRTDDQGYDLFSLKTSGRWELLDRFNYEEARISQPAALNKEGTILYFVDNRKTDKAILKSVDLKTGKTRDLATDPFADFRSSLLLHPRTRRVQSASAVYGRLRRHFLDPTIKKDFLYLRTLHSGDVGVAGRSVDDRVWLIAYLDGGPSRYYVYDRIARKARFLFLSQSAVQPFALARRQAVVVPTRDGLKLPGDLYLPSWSRAGRGKYVDHPLPMLLYVHGGPSVAYDWDNWLINRTLQLLANRGYAVFRVEFRGVEGFGKKIREAGAREWGRKMNDDLIDAVDWAVKQNITEKDRVGLWGWSYGGYATLAALTFTPNVFACGMAMYHPTDLQTMMETRSGSLRNFWRRLVGDETTTEGRAQLHAQSPLYFTERITKPLLITHGALDTNVPRKYSDDFVAAMKQHQKPVTYLLYADEGHDYQRKENWISLFAVAERFFHEHLGGRYEPFSDDFAGSSMQVIEGEALIPELSAALKTRSSSGSDD
jgi:dipeptidyl aminopeptidase/acylaminoacyl peptidase